MTKFDDEPSPAEGEVIAACIAQILKMQNKLHKPGAVARRGLHAKSLGTVNASLTVRELPSDLRIGVFASPKTYKTVMRFSNGGMGPEAFDILPNVRGLAFKLYDVPGKKCLQGEEDSVEHDFIMANYPAFFVEKAEQMLLVLQGRIAELIKQRPTIIGETFLATSKLIASPLDIDYFSQVPYLFGERACKYALMKPPGYQSKSTPNPFDRDYMRHSIENHLRKSSADFILCVQIQEEGDSISDSTKPWRGKYSPLADLSILKTEKPIKESDGEELSFNPCRVLAEHAPLAWPGRLRRDVYAADFAWRTKQNQ